MTTEEKAHKIDRTGWPKGPWDDEPDKVNWVTKAWYAGMIVRNHGGALCGYVGVPSKHPHYARTTTIRRCPCTAA